MIDSDVQYLRRAIRLAMNGRGRVEPNPMVGCVIVKDDRVIGEGFHAEFGGPHAEPAALEGCSESPAGATAYVTLEPCCHTDKKTPPCVPKLIAPFVARTVFQRPYITLKWAQSADGKVSSAGGARMQISNATSTRVVHALRSRSDAILVGVNTILSDDPMLTARGVERSQLSLRIILDSQLRTPLDSQLARTANDLPVDLFFTRDGFISADPQRIKQLMSTGINLIAADETEDGRISIPKLLKRESFGEITHLLVEPGPRLAQSFFDAGAADRVWVIQSEMRVDASDATAAPTLPSRYVKTAEVNLDGDVLTEYLDRESDLFFVATESADLALTGAAAGSLQ